MTSVVVPENIQNIGVEPFYDCVNLQSVVWNAISSTTYYDYDQSINPLFLGCANITSFTIGELVEKLPQGLCYGLPISSIIIPDNVQSISASAFRECSNLTSLTIGKSVAYIDASAFVGCSSLVSVQWNAKDCRAYNLGSQVESFVLGNEVEVIPASLCEGMENLISIEIPSSVKKIGRNAFDGCNSLKGVYISDMTAWCNISIDGYRANPIHYSHNLFLNGDLVQDLVIPNDAESIGQYAFEGCTSLKSVTIPNSVNTIGIEAFADCENLEGVYINDLESWCRIDFQGGEMMDPLSNPLANAHNLYIGTQLVTDLVIPNSINLIKDFTFVACNSITSITIPNNITSIGKESFSGCGMTSINIPNSVTSIGNGAFGGCVNLTYIDIPNGVNYLGTGAFTDCTSLTSANISNSVANIEEWAFGGCFNLSSVVIGNGVKEIKQGAFVACPLKNITFGAGLRKIDVNAFTNIEIGCFDEYGNPVPKTDEAGNFVYTVEKVISYAKVPPTIENYGDNEVFINNFSNATIYVMAESVAGYRAYDDAWGRLDIRPIGAESVKVEGVVVTPHDNSADFVWPSVSGAALYELKISDKDGNPILTLSFNGSMQLTNIVFHAPARNGAPQQQAETVDGYRFTVTGLDVATNYRYSIIAKDESSKILAEYTGSFGTIGAPEDLQALENVQNVSLQSTKILRNGQVYIERNGKTYDATGRKVN